VSRALRCRLASTQIVGLRVRVYAVRVIPAEVLPLRQAAISPTPCTCPRLDPAGMGTRQHIRGARAMLLPSERVAGQWTRTDRARRLGETPNGLELHACLQT
jgi:hypothetical protein